MKRNSRELKQRLSGRWDQALLALVPSLADAISKPGENVDSFLDGDADGLRVFRDVAETGGGVVQNLGSEGVFPDGIAFIMHLTGRSFVDVFDELSEWLEGYDFDKTKSGLYESNFVSLRETALVQRIKDDTSTRAWLNHLWSEGKPLTHEDAEPARRYLEGRGILAAALKADCFMFHPKLHYKHKGTYYGAFPGIMAVVRNNIGHPVSIHRIFLTPEGQKLQVTEKAPARKQCESLSSDIKGRVITLGQCAIDAAKRDGVIGIAEGLETALAVMQGARIPVVSCISTSNMNAYRPPQGVRTVLIFVDIDRTSAGLIAAKRFKQTLEGEGYRAKLVFPDLKRPESAKSVDWADQLIADQAAFVKVKREYHQSIQR